MAIPEDAQLSEDGQWWWDGDKWRAVEAPQASYDTNAMAVGQFSDDGQWQWDGTDWQPAGGQNAGSAGLEFDEADFPNLFQLCGFSPGETGGYEFLASIGVGDDDTASA